MCGIAGVVHLDGSSPHPEQLQRMNDTLAHRGPDAAGSYLQGRVGLAHRRLAIIDLSDAGRQPMDNERGTIWLTYNGEIYNFKPLRAALQAAGHQFRSMSDSEVIIHAYEEWGTDCLQRFNGQFAFALWDSEKQALWLVRDRLGIKPLFYAHRQDRFLFGSEIKAILAYEPYPRELNMEALSYFLALNYTPAPHTLFQGIEQLLPGESLWLEVQSGGRRKWRYWQLQWAEQDDVDHKTGFAAQLEAAVNKRLMSDVPFGLFLSGGLDSSTIGFWMARALDRPVQSYAVAYQALGFDESCYARLLADAIGADHHERSITASAADILPTIVYHAEEPTADSSMIALYHLAKLARESVTMVLAGDGADEILAGYETYLAYDYHRLYRRLPASLHRNVIKPVVDRFPHGDGKVTFAEKLRRFLAAADLDSDMAHASWRQICDEPLRQALLGRQDVADYRLLYRDLFAESTAKDALNRLLDVDIRFYLPNDMLAKVDRMAMAHGLEARVPFLDHELVSFTTSLPAHLKRDGRRGKRILRDVMRAHLPAAIVDRRKQGFNAPVARWFRSELRPLLHDTLRPARLQTLGFLAPGPVARLLQEHDSGRWDHSHQLWGILSLALWSERFLTADSSTDW